MLVLVCGSRGWGDAGKVRARLARLPTGSTVMHGSARGADAIADRAARSLGLAVDPHPVSREEWLRYGKAAGIRRNRAMLDRRPDLVIAFWDGASPGTCDTVEEAERRNILVEVIRGVLLGRKELPVRRSTRPYKRVGRSSWFRKPR